MEQHQNIPDSFHIDMNAFYNAIVNSTEDYIYIVDMVTDLSLVSENMARDFEVPGRIVPGLVPLWGELIHEKDKKRYYDSIDEMMSGQTDVHNVEYQIRNRKNEYVWVHCRGLLTRNEDSIPTMFAGVVTPVGSKGKVDQTTGLFTQEECKRRIESYLEQGNTSGGLLILGIDDFKRVNNLKNHTFGDTVLRKIAQDIQHMLPNKAEVFRFDGDEGGVFCPEASLKDMLDLYKKIHFYANQEYEIDGTSYCCTISGGVAMLGEDADNYMDLIKYAMSALDASKKKGKNVVTVFKPGMLESNLYTMELTNQLQRCVMSGMEGFSMVYQPFVKADKLVLSGAEALLRWSSPSFQKVGPAEFVPLLESSGYIVPVGKWVLEQAVRTCRKWIVNNPDFIMNVNVSYLQIIEEDFVPYIEELLIKYELPARHIVLEMTESYFVTDMPTLKATFQRMRDIGIKIAMDDFGTGYSSLGMLSQTPADIVKIDRVFISFINDKEHTFNKSFIQAVIQLCHSVGISVCVEGVEYADELHTVCEMSADSIQGYHISKPITQDEFESKYWKDLPSNRRVKGSFDAEEVVEE